jgi:hypothetical protein
MALPEEQRLLPALVHVADVLAARAEIGYCRTVLAREIAPEILAVLGLTETDLDAIEQTLVDDQANAMSLLSA